MMGAHQRIALGITLCLFLVSSPVESQTTGTSSSSGVGLYGTNVNLEQGARDKGNGLGQVTVPSSADTPPKTKKKHKRGEFAFAPIPMINPSIGNGGGAGVLYATRFGNDTVSPPSSLGAGGFATGRGSWGVGLGGRLNLCEDRYRITIGGGGGEFVYNYFGTGSAAGSAGVSIPLSQHSGAFLIEPKIRILPLWYLGPRYHMIRNSIGLGSSKYDLSNLPIPLPPDVKFQTAALGIRLQRDSSDSPFYPKKGSIFDTTVDFFGPAFGGDRTYQYTVISYNKYLSAGAKSVFAIHGSVCAASDKAPFFDLCQLGMSSDLRGYQIGQYRDHRMLVGQAEYRRELFWRLGAVAFAGAGAVGKDFGDFGDAEPGGGVGLRFVLAKKNHINLRADFAWGNNSRATYISLGEAF
jgi:hypothetical protein